MSTVPIITPEELKSAVDRGESITVIDVREDSEVAAGRLSFSQHIPLGDLPDRIEELDPQSTLVMQCKSGGRSGKATEFLIGQGFTNVRNLEGGLTAWRDRIDSSVVVA